LTARRLFIERRHERFRKKLPVNAQTLAFGKPAVAASGVRRNASQRLIGGDEEGKRYEYTSMEQEISLYILMNGAMK
jgi:hypothetical protein